MPTAAKLFGAAAFAILGWISANIYANAMPEGSQTGLMREIVALLGVIVGWRVLGGNAGKGYNPATGTGLRAGIILVFFALLGFSIYEMVLSSMQMRYDGPMEAVLGVFDLMMDYGKVMLTTQMIGTLVVGSILGGWFAEFGSRHWK
jgi:hypothetical protein